MVLLHAGPAPSAAVALVVLIALSISIFIAAAIISDLQRNEPRTGSHGARRLPDRLDD